VEVQVQETGNSSFKMVFGFIAVAVPLLSIAAYAGSVIARPPAVAKKIVSGKKKPDEITTGSVAPKQETSCSANKIDIRQRSSKFDFSFALGSSLSPADEPAP
jgi:hypothetical protein